MPYSRRRDRPVPGRDLRRPGRARPRARRLLQRRHAQRHQHAARRSSTPTSATTRSTRRTRCRTRRCRWISSRAARSVGGPIAARPDVLLREPRAAQSRSVRASRRSPTRTPRSINARLAAVGYPGSPVTTGVYPNPVQQPRTCSASWTSSRQRATSSACATRFYNVSSENSRGAGGAERAERVGGARQPRPVARVQQYVDALAAHRQRDARAVLARQPEGAADRSDRSGGQHRRRRRVRHARPRRPTAPRQHARRSRRQPVAPARARTPCARAWTSSTTTTRSRIRDRSAARTRSARWRPSSPACTTTPRLHADVRRRPSSRRRTPTSASTGRTSGSCIRA